ncbi:MAG: peptidase [Nitrosopumilaceae archaeon]
MIYGHGLGGESLPPIFIEGRDVTLSVNISPSTYDQKETERYITINLSESKSQAAVEHVTFEFELKKDGKQIFKDRFHDDLGNLVIKVINNNTNEIQIKGNKIPDIDAWMRTDTKPVIMYGPVFNSGGLYEYKIRIVTMDSDDNFLDKKIDLTGAVSLAEQNTYEVIDSKENPQKVNLISYFDTIESFEFNSGKIFFSMPFDWNQNFDQLSVVHQEIQVPEGFSELLHTKYEAKINGVILKDDSVTIDDYSSKGRTIHIVANKETLEEIRDQAIEASNSTMNFELGPSKDITLPLEAITPDLRYRIFLSWDPEIILPNQEITFFLEFEEMFSEKPEKKIEYDVMLSQNGKPIFNKHILGSANSENPDEFHFTAKNDGTIKLDIFDIEGNFLSRANFLVVVQPQEIREFPINLESISDSEPGKGGYDVDLTWFPNNLGLGESEFIITFYQKDTKIPVKGVSYDFVLIKDGKEIHRSSGIASSGGTFENFVFIEEESGDLTLRIDKINGTEEYVEIPINVAPEFSVLTSMILGFLILLTIIISKTKYVEIFKRQARL